MISPNKNETTGQQGRWFVTVTLYTGDLESTLDEKLGDGLIRVSEWEIMPFVWRNDEHSVPDGWIACECFVWRCRVIDDPDFEAAEEEPCEASP